MSEETKNTEEQVAATEVQETAIPAVDPKQFLADFNWHKYEQGIEAVDEEKLQHFEKALEGTVGFVNERDVIEGTVIRITDREYFIFSVFPAQPRGFRSDVIAPNPETVL